MAARLGIGPELVFSAPEDGFVVTRFVPGNPVMAEQLRTPDMLARVTGVLRTLHQGPPIPGTIDPFAAVDFYRNNAVARGTDPSENYAWARPIASQIQKAVGFAFTAPCHGDLLTANFIDNAGKIFLVDWEYAGMSDPRFDLANFSVNHGFGIDEDTELVRLYYGHPDERAVAAVQLLRFMSAFREATWCVVQQAISDLDIDFAEHARVHFARMRAAAAGEEFKSALALLETAGRPVAGSAR
jgi:aminoglycoside phosphotransferase (APT) family kinase protein